MHTFGSGLPAATGARPVGAARPTGQAALGALGSGRFRNPADRGAAPRPAGVGATLPVGQIARPIAPTPRWPYRLVSEALLGVSSGREARRLFQPCDTAPASTFLCIGDASPGRQSPEPDADARSQRYSHDP